jgi:hypothetical protein
MIPLTRRCESRQTIQNDVNGRANIFGALPEAILFAIAQEIRNS